MDHVLRRSQPGVVSPSVTTISTKKNYSITATTRGDESSYNTQRYAPTENTEPDVSIFLNESRTLPVVPVMRETLYGFGDTEGLPAQSCVRKFRFNG